MSSVAIFVAAYLVIRRVQRLIAVIYHIALAAVIAGLVASATYRG